MKRSESQHFARQAGIRCASSRPAKTTFNRKMRPGVGRPMAAGTTAARNHGGHRPPYDCPATLPIRDMLPPCWKVCRVWRVWQVWAIRGKGCPCSPCSPAPGKHVMHGEHVAHGRYERKVSTDALADLSRSVPRALLSRSGRVPGQYWPIDRAHTIRLAGRQAGSAVAPGVWQWTARPAAATRASGRTP